MTMVTLMNKKRKRDVKLPDEMLFEILSWLPAKSVCISKCCSKSFLNFTNSTNFARKQSQNSLLKDDSYFFIQDRLFRTTNTEIYSSLPSSSSATDQIPRDKVGVPSEFLRYVDENSVRIIASSNGLLLIKGHGQLSICNPTTQSHSYIPSPFTHGFEHCLGRLYSFECNNNDEDYKLYALTRVFGELPSRLAFGMYIPKEGVWKERETRFFLDDKYTMSFSHVPVLYKGAIHFPIYEISTWHKYLASYNVESGVSRIIKLPNGAEKARDEEVGIFKLGEVGSKNECICSVNLKGIWKAGVGYAFSVWVLSNYESSSGGWSKVFSVSLKELGLEFDGQPSRVVGFTVMNGRSLVFATEKEVYDYDLSGKREIRLQKVCDHLGLITSCMILLPYSDTLRSCGIGSTRLGV